MAPGAPQLVMGVVIDLQSRRLGVEVDSIRYGMETVANYLETDVPVITDAHQGYGVIDNAEDETLAVGKAGLSDFAAGFEGVIPQNTEQTASFAYGAFYAGRLLLPEVVMNTPAAAGRFIKIVHADLKHHPEADFPIMAESVAARAAASITVMALWGTFRNLGLEARLAFSRRVSNKSFPPSNGHVASAFKQRLDERTVLRILDKPVPHTK